MTEKVICEGKIETCKRLGNGRIQLGPPFDVKKCRRIATTQVDGVNYCALCAGRHGYFVDMGMVTLRQV